MDNIKQLALQFRKAIELALENGEFDGDKMYRRFPHACCGDTSDLLAQFLLDKGIKTDYVCGTYWGDSAENGQSHAWLIVDNHIIIDITGDQFKGVATFLNYNKSVYVGEMDQFHRLFHVETVALLSRINPANRIKVELDTDELDLTAAEAKATYGEIKSYVKEKHGFNVSSLYIAQVKDKYGMEKRTNYHVSKKDKHNIPKCPEEKEKVIVEALKHFKML